MTIGAIFSNGTQQSNTFEVLGMKKNWLDASTNSPSSLRSPSFTSNTITIITEITIITNRQNDTITSTTGPTPWSWRWISPCVDSGVGWMEKKRRKEEWWWWLRRRRRKRKEGWQYDEEEEEEGQ